VFRVLSLVPYFKGGTLCFYGEILQLSRWWLEFQRLTPCFYKGSKKKNLKTLFSSSGEVYLQSVRLLPPTRNRSLTKHPHRLICIISAIFKLNKTVQSFTLENVYIIYSRLQFVQSLLLEPFEAEACLNAI
jgi:hypothetical protein